jgi:hypothetical protein
VTPAQEKKLEVLLTQMFSALQEIALRNRKLKPYAYLTTNGSALTIPDGTKSFNVINLGLNGSDFQHVDIPVTGITGLTAIPKSIRVFGYSIENDQNQVTGPIVVTPPNLHHVVIQYLK